MSHDPQRPPLAKSSRPRRIIAMVLVSIGVLLVVVGFWLRDESPPDDSDLQPPMAEGIPEAENVIPAIIAAKALLVEPPEWYGLDDFEDRGESIDWENIDSLIAQNEPYFAALDVALARPRCRLLRSTMLECPHFSAMRSAQRWLTDRMKWWVHHGEVERAVDLWLRWTGVVWEASGFPGSVMDLYFCAAVHSACSATAVELAESPAVTIEQLARMKSRLAEAPSLFGSVSVGLRYEYSVMTQGIADGLPTEWSDRFPSWTLLYKPNATRRRYGGHVRAALRAFEARDPSLFSPLPEERGEIRWILGGNYAGESILTVFVLPFPLLYEQLHRVEASVAVHRVALALRAHELSEAELPVDLSSLVPRWLEPGVLDSLEHPLEYDRAARFIGLERRSDLEPVQPPKLIVLDRRESD
ncbi:MAG: hypothetical protein KDC38_06400 [Planctomycetes bacterium]|nr:hypothetical protein [Planctomycetota bacterium]